MTTEEKQLLLKDLCARLSYGVKFQGEDSNVYTLDAANYFVLQVENVVFKPYLRPLSSMTEEEKEEIQDLYHQNTQEVFKDPSEIRGYRFYDISVVDWLNEHHFDYRGLIPMGLALEAPEGMYES